LLLPSEAPAAGPTEGQAAGPSSPAEGTP